MPGSWLLREPLKGTAAVNFSQGRLGQAAVSSHSRELFQTMTQKRGQLLELLAQFRSSPDAVESAYRAYMAELLGLMRYLGVAGAGQDDASTEGGAAADAKPAAEGDTSPADEGAARRRARQAICWKWSDNISGEVNTHSDLTFEANNMTINYGLWCMKHAATIADHSAPQTDTDESAKDIFISLRRAAGIFQYLLEQHRSELAYLPNTDFDERMMEVRVQQCVAEAQEVTLERARAKDHKPTLVAAIARDEHERYIQAADALKSMDNKLAKRLRIFLLFKAQFYRGYMHCFSGIALFKEEKCGESIRALREAQSALADAQKLARDYVKIPISSGMSSRAPDDPVMHPLFSILTKTIKENLDKANRENGFIYNQRIPADVTEPPESKSLTEPMRFEPVVASSSLESAKLDLTKISAKGQNPAVDKASGDDAKVKHSPFDPVKPRGKEAADSGCTIA